MPARSESQFRLMAKAANNPGFAKKVGIDPAVAREFVHKTKNVKALPEHVKKSKP